MHSIKEQVIWGCYAAGWLNILRLYWQKKTYWYIKSMRSLSALGLATFFLISKYFLGILFLPLFFYACCLGLHFKKLAPTGRELSKKKQKEQIRINFISIRFKSLAYKSPPNRIHFFCAGSIYVNYAVLVFNCVLPLCQLQQQPKTNMLWPVYLMAGMIYWLVCYPRFTRVLYQPTPLIYQ